MSYCILQDVPTDIDYEDGDPVELTHDTQFHELCDTSREAAEQAANYLNYDAANQSPVPGISETYWVNGPCGSCAFDCPGRAHQPVAEAGRLTPLEEHANGERTERQNQIEELRFIRDAERDLTPAETALLLQLEVEEEAVCSRLQNND